MNIRPGELTEEGAKKAAERFCLRELQLNDNGEWIAFNRNHWVSVTQFAWNKAIEWSKETGKSVSEFEL